MRSTESDKRTPFEKFDDDVTELIDAARDELTVAEMVGCLELQIHVLKNRCMGYKQASKEEWKKE